MEVEEDVWHVKSQSKALLSQRCLYAERKAEGKIHSQYSQIHIGYDRRNKANQRSQHYADTEQQGEELAHGGWRSELAVHQRLEQSVLPVHATRLCDGISRCILDDDVGDKEYLSAVLDYASIKFVVLISRQFGIEHANPIEQVAMETAERHGVDLLYLADSNAEIRTADTERMTQTLGYGKRLGAVVGRKRVAHAAHIVGLELVKITDKA